MYDDLVQGHGRQDGAAAVLVAQQLPEREEVRRAEAAEDGVRVHEVEEVAEDRGEEEVLLQLLLLEHPHPLGRGEGEALLVALLQHVLQWVEADVPVEIIGEYSGEAAVEYILLSTCQVDQHL